MLTGLPNRVLFDERLEAARKKALKERKHFALVLLDLDGFKSINDARGHPAGDALLKAVAARLRENLRINDTVARLGGDEFAMIFENVAERALLSERGQQLRSVLAQPYVLVGRDGIFVAKVTASIGIVLCAGHDHDFMIQAADRALYMAKAAGKDGCVVSDVTSGLVTPESTQGLHEERFSAGAGRYDML